MIYCVEAHGATYDICDIDINHADDGTLVGFRLSLRDPDTGDLTMFEPHDILTPSQIADICQRVREHLQESPCL